MNLDDLIAGRSHDPHGVLGAHPAGDTTVIRALRRGAGTVTVVADDERHPMRQVHGDGVFEAELPGVVTDYRIDADGVLTDDPYRHLPTVGELDLHLIQEGRHERLWTVLGAQIRPGGVAFAVWAPNARGVRVVGDFTGWDVHAGWPMRSLGGSGVWEIFVPGAQAGHRYKFRLLTPDDGWVEKADPSPSTPRSHRRPRRWCTAPATTGRTPTGSPSAPSAAPTRRRSASTRSTSARGAPGCPMWSSPTS